MVEKVNYKISVEEVHNIIDNKNDVLFSLYLDQNEIIDPVIIDEVISYGSYNSMQELIEKKGINLNDYMTLNKFNNFIQNAINTEKILYILENTNVKITPYTTQIYINSTYYPNKKIIVKFLNKTDNTITKQTKIDLDSIIQTHSDENRRWFYNSHNIVLYKKIIKKYKCIDYKPTEDEKVKDNGVVNYYRDGYMGALNKQKNKVDNDDNIVDEFDEFGDEDEEKDKNEDKDENEEIKLELRHDKGIINQIEDELYYEEINNEEYNEEYDDDENEDENEEDEEEDEMDDTI